MPPLDYKNYHYPYQNVLNLGFYRKRIFGILFKPFEKWLILELKARLSIMEEN